MLPPLLWVLLWVLFGSLGCDTATEPPGPSPATRADEGGVTWLDDADAAASVEHHRVAGQLKRGRVDEGILRRQARDALVARARALGFARLDNVQIEVQCSDDATLAEPCEARFVAILSR